MSPEKVRVGIDVSKDRLDVSVRPAGSAFAVANDEGGIDGLVARLAREGATLVVLEATGGFERPVAAALAAAGVPVPRSPWELAEVDRTLTGALRYLPAQGRALLQEGTRRARERGG